MHCGILFLSSLGWASQFFLPVWLFRHSTLSEHVQLIFNHSNMENFRKTAVKIAQKKYEDLESEVDFSDKARSKIRSSRKTWRISFCTIPKTENSELETSEFSQRFTRTAIFFNYLIKLRGLPTPSFQFCTTLKMENLEMENLRV